MARKRSSALTSATFTGHRSSQHRLAEGVYEKGPHDALPVRNSTLRDDAALPGGIRPGEGREIESHHPLQLLQDLFDRVLEAGLAVDRLQHLAQGLRLHPSPPLGLDGELGLHAAPLARDLLAHGVQDLLRASASPRPASRVSTSRSRRSVFMVFMALALRECSRLDRGPPLDTMPGGRPVTRERILFVCTANVDRSRTAEDLYADDPRYEVRSAGTAPFATLPLTRDLLLWADRVFVMNEREDPTATLIKMRFPGRGPADRGPRPRGPLARGATRSW